MVAPVFIWCLVFWAYAYVSIVWAQNVSFALAWRSRTIQTIGLVATLSYAMRDKESALKYMELLLAANVFATTLTLLLTPVSSWGTERMGAATGINSNTLAMRASYSATFALFLSLYRKRPLFFLAIIPLVIAVLLSGSRKGILSLAAIPALYLLLRDRGFKMVRNVVIVGIMLFAMYQILRSVPVVYEALGRRVERLVQYMTGEGAGGYSELERQFYREYAYTMWLQKPVFGWGLNQFAAQMQAIGYSHVAYSHNNYCELLACLGLVGFVLYYAYLICMGIRLVKYRHTGNELVPLAIAMLVVMAINDYGMVSFREIDTWIYLTFLSSVLLQLSKDGSE